MAAVQWWYFMIKFTKLFDAIFLNLERKIEEVSPSYIIKHSLMPIFVWIRIKFAAGKILYSTAKIFNFSQILNE